MPRTLLLAAALGIGVAVGAVMLPAMEGGDTPAPAPETTAPRRAGPPPAASPAPKPAAARPAGEEEPAAPRVRKAAPGPPPAPDPRFAQAVGGFVEAAADMTPAQRSSAAEALTMWIEREAAAGRIAEDRAGEMLSAIAASRGPDDPERLDARANAARAEAAARAAGTASAASPREDGRP